MRETTVVEHQAVAAWTKLEQSGAPRGDWWRPFEEKRGYFWMAPFVMRGGGLRHAFASCLKMAVQSSICSAFA